jgi:hypothetical protein
LIRLKSAATTRAKRKLHNIDTRQSRSGHGCPKIFLEVPEGSVEDQEARDDRALELLAKDNPPRTIAASDHP